MTDLHWLTAHEAARRFDDRTLSPVEYVRALLDRIEALDPRLNVFLRLDAEGALAAAREAEREIFAGRRRSAIHGIPVAIKDIIDVRGLPTTAHSRVLIDNVAAADAAVVQRLRAAGAIVLGKVATHEFAIGGPSFDLPFPPARNPWNRGRHPGGSSSGSGAGLAAGLFPLALGTDTAGSIRNPAGACGVVGVKPTYDRVPRAGVFPLAYTLDHIGPMARSVRDAADFLDAMGGPPAARAPGGARSGVRGLRIGFVRHFHEADMPAAPEVKQSLEDAARVLTELGAVVSEIALPSLNDFSAVNRVILHAEAWSIHAEWLRARPGAYGQLSRRRLMTGAFLGAGDHVDAMRRRRQLVAAVEAAFAGVDLLLTANSMEPPCRIDSEDDIARTYPRQARTPFNVTGHPALCLMSGLSPDGLPLSLQLVGKFWDEPTVFAAAEAYEQATDWHRRHPAVD